VKLEDWEAQWLLNFNPKKCKVMHLNFNNNLLQRYFLDGISLEYIKSEKDLGLLVDENLS
jgi:hypothetical protein